MIMIIFGTLTTVMIMIFFGTLITVMIMIIIGILIIVMIMIVSCSRCVVATGQGPGYYRREGQPHIRVWNSVSLQTLSVLGVGDFRRAVSSLSFSRTDGGEYLVSVDDSPDHVLCVWDWSRGVKQVESKCSSETVVSAEFHPVEDGTIVSCGRLVGIN